MNNLIVIPFHDFKTTNHGFRTRDAHLYEHFINDLSIDNLIIVNRPTSLIEVILKRKKIKSIENIIYRNKFCFIQEFKKKVFIIDFLVFDILNVILKKHAWLPYIYSRNDIIEKLRKALNFLKIESCAVYMSSPFSVKMGLKLGANYKMLDAVDNFAKYKNWEYFRKQILSLYEIAKSEYEIILVNSEDTYKFLNENCKAKLKLVPNGVDSKRFKGSFIQPKDLPENKIIVGYAGKIQRMFNTDLMASLAKTFPEVIFVILGKFLDKKWKKQYWDCKLSHLENILFLGEKSYNDLPSYYNHFDICFIPYYIEKQHGGDPIKFYEYMASNKPIVSTNIGNIKKFHNSKDIFICNNETEFIKSIEYLLNKIKNNSINTSHSIPSEIEWETIAKNIINNIFLK